MIFLISTSIRKYIRISNVNVFFFEWHSRRFRLKKNRWWYVKVKVCLHLENLWHIISIFTTQIWGHKGHYFNTIFFVRIVQNQFNNHVNIMIEVIRVSRTAGHVVKNFLTDSSDYVKTNGNQKHDDILPWFEMFLVKSSHLKRK